jgi:hypothetical protein
MKQDFLARHEHVSTVWYELVQHIAVARTVGVGSLSGCLPAKHLGQNRLRRIQRALKRDSDDSQTERQVGIVLSRYVKAIRLK